MSKRTIIISCVICIGLIVFVIVGLTGGNIGQPGKETQNADASSQSTVTENTEGSEAKQQLTDTFSVDTNSSANTGTSQKSADPTDSKSELEEEDIVQSPEGLELPPERIEGTQEHEQGPGQDQPQSPGQGSTQQGQNQNEQNQPQDPDHDGQQAGSDNGSTGNKEILPGGGVEMPAIPIRR